MFDNNGQQGGILSDGTVNKLLGKVLAGLAKTCKRDGPQFFDIDGDTEPELIAFHVDNVPSEVEDYVAHERRERDVKKG